MITGPVLDFFVDEDEPALRAQAQWLEEQLGLGTPFFAKLLRMEEAAVADWRRERTSLSPDRQETLRELWQAFMHLLSHMGFDEERVRGMLDFIPPLLTPNDFRSPVAPPWLGTSLRNYLATQGLSAIDKVIRWVTGFRFGNPYAGKQEVRPCQSSQD